MDTDWMNTVTALLAQRESRVIRFELPDMAAQRIDGRQRPPDRTETKMQCMYPFGLVFPI
jgi:predicted alpha/beta-hydrolase family hydrolase